MEKRDPWAKRSPMELDLEGEVARLIDQQRSAETGLVRMMNRFGGQLEARLRDLPDGTRTALENGVRAGLELSYNLASASHVRPADGPVAAFLSTNTSHKLAAVATGAAGGAGGFASTILELPATITMMFRAVQTVAREHGEDPSSHETRMVCLKVFGSGGPGTSDDGVDTSFVSLRLGASEVLPVVIATVAPRLAAVLGQKVVAQAVPVIGAVAGGTVNYAFMEFYQQVAGVRFGLRALARVHGEEAVTDAVRAALAKPLPEDADAV